MAIIRQDQHLISLIHELRRLTSETEWVEFKHNNADPEEIGEYISAISNSTALAGKVNGYVIWGIDDRTHSIVGTTFQPESLKKGNEALENWLLRQLSPKINFHFYTLNIDGMTVVILEIDAAFRHPVQFKGDEYIRVGSYKKKLKDHPEKERDLWRAFDHTPFEQEIAADNLSTEDILHLLNYYAYFELMKLPLPQNHASIMQTFQSENMITEAKSGLWNITNLGAILFAKKLSDFSHLKRKAVRIIQYSDASRIKGLREESNEQGYAVGYESIIKSIMQLVPTHEVIELAFRRSITMFPEIAIRELVANAMIHQNFHIRGTSVMVELFSNRIEVTNPGLPLVRTDRFLDSPPRSRNEGIASFMRRINICEERGSGIDNVVIATEGHQLPPPTFRTTDEHTIAMLSAYKPFREMDKLERVQACYLHASLRFIQNNLMTNTSLRERFKIDIKNSAIVSRVISDAMSAELIRYFDESVGTKARKYVPWWS